MSKSFQVAPLNALPNVAPTDPSLAGSVWRLTGGNSVLLLGQVTAGSGKLYCCWYDSDAGLWWPLSVDANDQRSLALDSTKPTGALAGYFSGTFLVGDCAALNFCAVFTGNPTFASNKIWARGRRL